MQEAVSSEEFTEWQFADACGEILDDYDRAGMIAAAIANFGLSPPKKPISAHEMAEAFRPKRIRYSEQKDKAITLGEKLTAQPRQANVSSNGLTWKL